LNIGKMGFGKIAKLVTNTRHFVIIEE